MIGILMQDSRVLTPDLQEISFAAAIAELVFLRAFPFRR
jgi:hypothetical protein